MTHSDAEKWNDRYRDNNHDRSIPARVLSEYPQLLPQGGTALDLACGTGANALFLARHGLQTSAWDFSPEAISLLQTQANENHLAVATCVCDVTETPIPASAFDVITVSYFLDRSLFPALINALKTGGLLYYQTWLRERIGTRGPRNENFLLGVNELLHLCQGLRIVLYREEGLIGDPDQGLRDEAMLIGQRM